MNIKQAMTVERLKRKIWEHDALCGGENYEFKQWEVKEEYGFVFVVSEIGLIGDEGTAASILCRTHRHIMIGVKGGMQLLNAAKFKKRKDGSLKKVCKKTTVRGWKVAWALTM